MPRRRWCCGDVPPKLCRGGGEIRALAVAGKFAVEQDHGVAIDRHCLLCGDARSLEDMDRLMASEHSRASDWMAEPAVYAAATGWSRKLNAAR